MVFYFLSEIPEVECYYMGKDKFENEELIKYALPHDVWFQAEGYCSTHIYMRMKDPKINSYIQIPEPALLECA